MSDDSRATTNRLNQPPYLKVDNPHPAKVFGQFTEPAQRSRSLYVSHIKPPNEGHMRGGINRVRAVRRIVGYGSFLINEMRRAYLGVGAV